MNLFLFSYMLRQQRCSPAQRKQAATKCVTHSAHSNSRRALPIALSSRALCRRIASNS